MTEIIGSFFIGTAMYAFYRSWGFKNLLITITGLAFVFWAIIKLGRILLWT